MTEVLDNKVNTQKQEEFQKTLTQMLSDFKIDSKEARELLKKYDLEKKELIQLSKEQLQLLKNQFWEELDIDNLVEFIQRQASLYLEVRKPDENLLYEWLSDYDDFEKNSKYDINLKNQVKPEQISENDWNKAKEFLDLIKELNITDWKISYTKDKWLILELDTSWSNLYIKFEWGDVVITWQNDWVLFVEKLSKEDFQGFVRNYDNIENKRVLEQLWFTWWLTLWWILAFSLRTWIWFLLWNIWFWLWAYRWYNLYKSYNLSRSESIQVLKENKDNPEVVKSYLYLSQIWYITWYDNWTFETIDGEKLTKEQIISKKEAIVDNEIQQYQLLRWLKEQWYKPKFLKKGKYELDMFWLFDNSPLVFDWNNIKFSTSNFENWKELNFTDIKTAFEKIQKINECLSLESQLKNSNNDNNNFTFNNGNVVLEQKIQKIKQEILEK